MHGCFTSKAFVFYIFFAFAIGFSVNRAAYSVVVKQDWVPILTLGFLASVAGNAYHHYMLRLMKTRRANMPRTFPNGAGFELVACPHYFCECCIWLFYALLSNTMASWAFFASVLGLLLVWSRQRYLKYTKMKGWPSHRRALIPFLY